MPFRKVMQSDHQQFVGASQNKNFNANQSGAAWVITSLLHRCFYESQVPLRKDWIKYLKHFSDTLTKKWHIFRQSPLKTHHNVAKLAHSSKESHAFLSRCHPQFSQAMHRRLTVPYLRHTILQASHPTNTVVGCSAPSVRAATSLTGCPPAGRCLHQQNQTIHLRMC